MPLSMLFSIDGTGLGIAVNYSVPCWAQASTHEGQGAGLRFRVEGPGAIQGLHRG